MAFETMRILVVGPSWVGDMVMAQSLFVTLRQTFENCLIDVLAPGWTLPLLTRMPEVSEGIEMPLQHGQFELGQRIGLGKKLSANRYHRAIVLPNSWKSALTPFFAKIPIRTGYVGELRWGLLNDMRRLDKTVLKMTVQRFVALAPAKHSEQAPSCPPPKLEISPLDILKVQEKFRIGRKTRKVLALCPGAEFGPAKRWPATHFVKIAQRKIEQGWLVWIFGSANDQQIAMEIQQECAQDCLNFSGRTSLAEAVDLLSLADIVVSNDSGLMHIAAALDKQMIAIYGSSDPAFTPPLSEKATIISLGMDCSPCFQRDCPLVHTKCLVEVTPERILRAMETA